MGLTVLNTTGLKLKFVIVYLPQHGYLTRAKSVHETGVTYGGASGLPRAVCRKFWKVTAQKSMKATEWGIFNRPSLSFSVSVQRVR